MKKLGLLLIVASFVPVAFANATEVSVDPSASAGVYGALLRSGALPRGPATVSRTIRVTDLGCTVGYNQFMRTGVADCSFADGNRQVKISGRLASSLFTALVKAKLAKYGPAEMSSASVKALDCTATNFDGLKNYSCIATN